MGLVRMFRVQLPWECWKCSLGHAVSQNSLVVSHRLWTEKVSPNTEFLTFFTLFNVTLKGPEVLSFKESEWKEELPHLGNEKTETERQESAFMAALRLEIQFYFSVISLPPPSLSSWFLVVSF